MKLSPNKSPFRYSLGDRGEAAAAGHLKKLRFNILQKNYRCPLGEIDLIAEKEGRIHFVEIKTRKNIRQGSPEEAVDLKKQVKIVKLASWYLKEKNLKDPKVSLDVVAVIWKDGGPPEIRLIEGAFEKQEES